MCKSKRFDSTQFVNSEKLKIYRIAVKSFTGKTKVNISWFSFYSLDSVFTYSKRQLYLEHLTNHSLGTVSHHITIPTRCDILSTCLYLSEENGSVSLRNLFQLDLPLLFKYTLDCFPL